MNYLRDLIHRLRLGQSDRAIARDMHLSRVTIRKYREMAQTQGYLDLSGPLPDLQTLTAALGPAPQPPCTSSSVRPFQEVVEGFLDQHVEMTAMLDRLRDDYGYTGSYSSLRRFVHHLRLLRLKPVFASTLFQGRRLRSTSVPQACLWTL